MGFSRFSWHPGWGEDGLQPPEDAHLYRRAMRQVRAIASARRAHQLPVPRFYTASVSILYSQITIALGRVDRNSLLSGRHGTWVGGRGSALFLYSRRNLYA